MRGSSSITDFFKPFAQPRQNKRPLPYDDPQEPKAIRPSPKANRQADAVKTKTQGTKASVSEGSRGHSTADVYDDALHVPITQSDGTDDALTKPETFPSTNKSDISGSEGLIVTSSQRIVKNGEVMITNSEDEATDSDASLDDIDDLLAPNKPAEKSSPPTEPELPFLTMENSSSAKGSKRRRETRGTIIADNSQGLPILPVLPKYKFSLELLVKQSKNHEESETQTAKARTLLRSLEQRENASPHGGARISGKGTKINEELVGLMMKEHGQDEDAWKLMTAIKRTEALYLESSWSFFNGIEGIPRSDARGFPQDHQFNCVLGEAHSRQQAFLNGYVGEIAGKRDIPDEILLWMMDAICFETRDDLNHSYISTLKGAGNQITPFLTPERLDSLFRNVGASTEALSKLRPIIPKPVIPSQKGENHRPRLLSVIRLLRELAVLFSAESRTHAIELLCRLLADYSVTSQCHTLVAIEKAFMRLVESIPERDFHREILAVLRTIYPCVADPILQTQLLHNIPASSPRLTIFRRRLSLAFFFQDTLYLDKQPTDLLDLRQISRHLQKPQFTIRNNTDYTELGAFISILSIGIDAGDPPPTGSHASQEAAFNASVDLLSDRIKAMFTQIVDAGASHKRRTEAKEVLEAFHSRLLYAVRTKRKPKTTLAGESDIDVGRDSRQGDLMRGFLERVKQKGDLTVPNQE